MSWLYAQTWLWYLIAFVVGVLLAWLILVLPQQRRLRTLQSVAGAGIDHDLYADSRSGVAAGAAVSGAALFDSGSNRRRTDAAAEDPATEQFPPVDPAANSPDTTEIPVQPAPDDSTTGEIPVVSEADAAGDRAEATGTAAPDSGNSAEPGDSAPAPAADATTDPAADAATDPAADAATDAAADARIDETTAESNGRAAIGATLGAAALAGTAGRHTDPPAGSAAESAIVGCSAGDTGPAADTEAADSAAATAAAGSTVSSGATTDADSTDADADSTDADSTDADSPDADSTDADSTDADSSGADSTADSSGYDTATAPPATETAPAKGSGSGVQSLLAAAAATKVTAGRYPGSALSGPDGAAPSDEYTIKGNADSMLFHTPESPYYGRTKAELWFSNAEDAEAAGFTSWSRKK